MYLLQLISIIIYIIIIMCAMYDYKRTIIMWIPLSYLINNQVCPSYASPIALTVIVNLSLILLYFTIKKSVIRKDVNMEKFIFFPFIVFTVFSVSLSTFLSIIPFEASINNLIKSRLVNYCMVYIFFRCINTRKDIQLFVKTCIVVALLITINGLIENFIHINPAGDFIYFNSPHTDQLRGRSYYTPFSISGRFNQRFGLTRCYSFFGLHIHFGVTCLFLLFLIMFFKINKFNFFNKTSKLKFKIISLSLILLLIGVFLSNSKTPMLGLMILLFTFYRFKDIFKFKHLIFLAIGVFILLYYAPQYLNTFLSITDEELAEEGGGSSIAMRKEQLLYILKLFYQNPIFGNGVSSALYFSKNVSGFELIRGAESVWFKLACDQGIIGFIAYFYSYININKVCNKIIPKRIVIFYLLSVFVMETATGYLNFLLWLPILIVIRRYYQLNK